MLGPEMRRAINQGVQHGLRQGGGASLWVLIILVAVTLGTWLIWELIRGAPALLADTIIDAELVPSRPHLIFRMPARRWLSEAFGSTALQFIGLTIAAYLLGISWPFDFTPPAAH
jgi:hypothetical protein